MRGLTLDAVALLAQCFAFVAGLIVSLLVGMYLGAHLDGPGGLLIATVIAGAGLLGSAVGSQSLRDYLIRRES